MARYRLTKPHYLGVRYYPEGSVVDWDGPPSKDGMIGLDEHDRPVPARAPRLAANEVPMPGGEPPDPTWAPGPRPAFATKTLRKPQPDDESDQASIVRVPAAAPSASAPSGGPTPGQKVVGETPEARAAAERQAQTQAQRDAKAKAEAEAEAASKRK